MASASWSSWTGLLNGPNPNSKSGAYLPLKCTTWWSLSWEMKAAPSAGPFSRCFSMSGARHDEFKAIGGLQKRVKVKCSWVLLHSLALWMFQAVHSSSSYWCALQSTAGRALKSTPMLDYSPDWKRIGFFTCKNIHVHEGIPICQETLSCDHLESILLFADLGTFSNKTIP